jgi:hypothetical protein
MIRKYLVVLGCFLTACGSPQKQASRDSGGTALPDTTSGPVHGGRVVIGVQQEPEMLSEILNSMATNNMVCNLLFSKFVKYDDHFKLVPDLITAIPTVETAASPPTTARTRTICAPMRAGTTACR